MNFIRKTAAASIVLSLSAAAAIAASDTASGLTAKEQKLGHSVVVKSVTAAKDGWVVIHATKDGKPVVPASIGHTYVKAGTTKNVYVPLTAELENNKVIAMLHVDDGELGVYQFGPGNVKSDKPVAVAGKVVVAPIAIDK